ncbi:MAG TPA: hypothetical protein VH877_28660 [Polyangia bacterium]|jgi:hypothetical protein|nr:hypothetical protein [Polyangia bacterium]
MNKPVVFKWIIEGNLMVTCSTAGEMVPERWREYINELRDKKITKVLGLNLGSVSLNSVQRREVGSLVQSQGIVSAVVTDDRMIRGVVTAISWFGGNVKAYSWDELKEAIKFLGVGPEERIVAIAHRLKRECQTG